MDNSIEGLLIESNKYGKKWSEEETILAYYYYCQIPFGKIHKTNPKIIEIANMLGRTPSSVVLKMGNIGHFDPELKKRNVTGLKNASKLDEFVVQQFYSDWESLAYKAQQIESSMTASINTDIEISLPNGEDTIVESKRRLNQSFFRKAVLSSYKNTCCITGITVPTLLIASHIKPWAVSNPQTERTNPSNGLCLNALHDKAFDKGLITVLPDYTVRVSSKLKKTDNVEWLLQCDRNRIILPEKFYPSKEFLEYHNDVIFVS